MSISHCTALHLTCRHVSVETGLSHTPVTVGATVSLPFMAQATPHPLEVFPGTGHGCGGFTFWVSVKRAAVEGGASS